MKQMRGFSALNYKVIRFGGSSSYIVYWKNAIWRKLNLGGNFEWIIFLLALRILLLGWNSKKTNFTNIQFKYSNSFRTVVQSCRLINRELRFDVLLECRLVMLESVFFITGPRTAKIDVEDHKTRHQICNNKRKWTWHTVQKFHNSISLIRLMIYQQTADWKWAVPEEQDWTLRNSK